MTAAGPTSRHPSASVMLRRLDGELDPRLDHRLGRHLARCEPCRDRLERLRTRSDEVSRALGDALAATPVAEVRRAAAKRAVRAASERVQAHVRRARGWAAAASVAGLLILSWTVAPLRAWVWERGPDGGSGEGAPLTATLPGAVVGTEGSIVAFTVAGEEFSVHLESEQPAGDLLLQVLPIDRATAQITRGTGESILVLPSALRVENSSTSTASYRLALPLSVERVVVRIGSAAPRVISVGDEGWSAEIAVR